MFGLIAHAWPVITMQRFGLIAHAWPVITMQRFGLIAHAWPVIRKISLEMFQKSSSVED